MSGSTAGAATLGELARRDPVPVDMLRHWRDAEAAAVQARGGTMFMGKPTVWFEDCHWFCGNGHVSGTFLKCEDDGDRCLACRQPVILGPRIGEREFAPIIAALRARATGASHGE